tara:strand:- start:11105 stop:13738 length:2634 start_codon:yes stop_codon:yes gene_type:complete
MLAVIGLEISFASVKDTDAFDYHLYYNKPIPLTKHNNLTKAICATEQSLQRLLDANHLTLAEVDLILLNEPLQGPSDKISDDFDFALQNRLVETLSVKFSDLVCSMSLGDALLKAQQVSKKKQRALVILSINQSHFDGVAALLVCDKCLLNGEQAWSPAAKKSQLSLCHSYAEIDANSYSDLVNNTNSFCAHIEQFITKNNFTTAQIESVVISQNRHQIIHSNHQRQYLTAFENINKSNPSIAAKNLKSTLLTSVDCIDSSSNNFASVLALFASILCLDQHYRLGSKLSLINEQDAQVNADWQASVFYCLPQSTSYLPTKNKSVRHIIVSHCANSKHQLILISQAQNLVNRLNNLDSSKVPTQQIINNGFLAQHKLKPVIFNAASVGSLLSLLNQFILHFESKEQLSFTPFCELQYQLCSKQADSGDSYYCVVLLASSFTTLKQQIQLALAGIVTALENNKPWKTPAGSYFSGQLVNVNEVNCSEINTNKVNVGQVKKCKPLSFIYPGVGALYVNMGKDLLRLFPQAYLHLLNISDDLAHSLQDHLMTPRLLTEPDFPTSVELEKSLRKELANIAEAGVSYACLLTSIYQQQLQLKATSAAGYSMGEVSMFAALGCWKTPQIMSQRLRESSIFTEQLSGPLKRLQSAWAEPDINVDDVSTRWESYHLKASFMLVESLLSAFPRVYITIINTNESLVIAGEPVQCLKLAKQLNVRAIALNVPNIIHCELAKSEYENMQNLYSLAITQKISCQFFSSSCYLPVPMTEKAIAVSISKCLTELVDFPRLIKKIADCDETVFIEMGAGKSLSSWIERILKNQQLPQPITCLSVDQKNLDDYSAMLKTIAPLISLGYQVNCQPFFNGSLIRPVKKMTAPVLVS